jgi:hypothetical protein
MTVWILVAVDIGCLRQQSSIHYGIRDEATCKSAASHTGPEYSCVKVSV